MSKMNLNLMTAAAIIAIVVGSGSDAWGRGFGGGRGGGGGGGGFSGRGGGGYGGGSYGGGSRGGYGGRSSEGYSRGGGRSSEGYGGSRSSEGYGGGGRSSEEFSNEGRGESAGRYGEGSSRYGSDGYGGGAQSGYRGEGSRSGAYGNEGAGRYGASGNRAANDYSRPNSSQLNSFLGLPSDAGAHSVATSHPYGNDFDVNTGSVTGPRGGEAAGATVSGPRGNTYGAAGAVGPYGGVAGARGFEGANGAAGFQAGAIGPDGRAIGGSAVAGPNGGYAARGAAVGPYGAAAGYAYSSPSGQYTNAAAIRSNFNGYGMYSPNWYTAHPGAWYAAGLTTGAWNAATWNSVGDWYGYDDATVPVDYNYGTNVVTSGNDVYVDGQDVGTSDDYYQQSQALASSASQAQSPPDAQWMPLGVFAVSQSGQSSSLGTIQLAVDKSSQVRGNYTDKTTNKTQPVQGAIDKKTQRVAWTIGDNKDTVIEAGLYNLTKDEATALVHEGKDKTEQWLLVRLKQPDQSSGADQPNE